MQMELNIEEVKKTDIKTVKDDLNSIMAIFTKVHFDKENEKVLENALSTKKEWHMKVNGKMINARATVDKFGLTKVLFKASGIMAESSQEYLHGLMEATIRVNSMIM